jgi:hypothetical protein
VTQVFAKDPCRLAHFLFSSLFHQCEATSAITKN